MGKSYSKLLQTKPLYFELLKRIIELEEQRKVDVTPSAIAASLNKAISTVSEPLKHMQEEGLLFQESTADSRKKIYKIKDPKKVKRILKELEKSESLRSSRIRLTKESEQITRKFEDKISSNLRNLLKNISNKISVMTEHPISTILGKRQLDLIVSFDIEKIKIGVNYKLILGEKKLRPTRMANLRNIILKKYFTEMLGDYSCIEKNELNGLLLVLIIPGIDTNAKIQLEEAIKKLRKKDFNLDILVLDVKKSEFDNEKVIEYIGKDMISKLTSLKDTAKVRIQTEKENELISQYAWSSEKTPDSSKKTISVVGVGGAGNNIVGWLFNKGLTGAELIALNTDQQHLDLTNADKKILLGKETTKGLGCGGFLEKGKKAFAESKEQISKILDGKELIIIAAGLGGGTGSGAAPLLAELAKSKGILTISFVTLPFRIERARIEKAEAALDKIHRNSDITIVLDNNDILYVGGNLPVQQAFVLLNEIISSQIKGMIETILTPSLVNIDYVDFKALLSQGNIGTVGFGSSDSVNRAHDAAVSALKSTLAKADFQKVSGALINILGGEDMTLDEVSQIGELITEKLNPEADVIWGAKVDKRMKGKILVSIIFIWKRDRKKTVNYETEIMKPIIEYE